MRDPPCRSRPPRARQPNTREAPACLASRNITASAAHMVTAAPSRRRRRLAAARRERRGPWAGRCPRGRRDAAGRNAAAREPGKPSLPAPAWRCGLRAAKATQRRACHFDRPTRHLVRPPSELDPLFDRKITTPKPPLTGRENSLAPPLTQPFTLPARRDSGPTPRFSSPGSLAPSTGLACLELGVHMFKKGKSGVCS